MFPSSFTTLKFYQKKRDAILFQATNESNKFFLKVILKNDVSANEALHDEYNALSTLSHPGIPVYYGIDEHFSCPGIPEDCIAMCIEDCTPNNPLKLSHLSESMMIRILSQVGEILSYLLSHGILYTDLNPANILVDMQEEVPVVSLIDFTYCYYFLANPRPSYRLRFSYNLDPSLKGQQLLIQELALLLNELITLSPDTSFSSATYTVLQTGLHPSKTLSLEHYVTLLKQLIV